VSIFEVVDSGVDLAEQQFSDQGGALIELLDITSTDATTKEAKLHIVIGALVLDGRADLVTWIKELREHTYHWIGNADSLGVLGTTDFFLGFPVLSFGLVTWIKDVLSSAASEREDWETQEEVRRAENPETWHSERTRSYL
jgi:replication fork protection complex subunit Tof1/Swi1